MVQADMAEKPLVSVVMPVYNASRFLRQAIESVLSQTYQNLELIAVDDCSTDDSLQILREYQNRDERLHVIAGETNQGVSRVRNRGIQEAKGKYIALLDSDDVWVNTKIERQVEMLDASGADIAYCSLGFIDENDKKIKKPFIVSRETNYDEMLVKCMFTCSTIMVKAEILKAHPFRNDFYHEDYLLWMELMALPVKTIGDQNVYMYNRQVGGSRSNDKLKAAAQRWMIYRKGLGLGLAKCSVTFLKYALWGIAKYYM